MLTTAPAFDILSLISNFAKTLTLGFEPVVDVLLESGEVEWVIVEIKSAETGESRFEHYGAKVVDGAIGAVLFRREGKMLTPNTETEVRIGPASFEVVQNSVDLMAKDDYYNYACHFEQDAFVFGESFNYIDESQVSVEMHPWSYYRRLYQIPQEFLA